MNGRVEDSNLMMSPTLHWPQHAASASGHTLPLSSPEMPCTVVGCNADTSTCIHNRG